MNNITDNGRHVLKHAPPLGVVDAGTAEHWLESGDEYDRMIAAMALYKPRPVIADWIWAAYHDPDWNWREKSDGCSFVNELHFPPGMRNPCCVMHDYLCQRGKYLGVRRQQADVLFLEAMLSFGTPVWRAVIRFLGVRWFALRKGLR